MIRKLLITPELLASICCKFTSGTDRREFIVIENGLPDNHSVVGCRMRGENMIEVDIESPEFSDESDLPTIVFQAADYAHCTQDHQQEAIQAEGTPAQQQPARIYV